MIAGGHRGHGRVTVQAYGLVPAATILKSKRYIERAFATDYVHTNVQFWYRTAIIMTMWHLSHIICPLQLWFSDGLPLETQRGLFLGESSRLIVDGQGFLDLTTIQSRQGDKWEMAANGVSLWIDRNENPHTGCPLLLESTIDPIKLSLHVDMGGNFALGADIPRALAGKITTRRQQSLTDTD